jgi:DNA modification methylase
VPCTVLDPFFGAATSGLIAAKDQRRCIGIELNACYLRLGHERMTTPHGEESDHDERCRVSLRVASLKPVCWPRHEPQERAGRRRF